MKKVLSLFMALVFVIVGGIALSACDEGKITGVFLQYNNEDVTFQQTSSSSGNTREYDLVATYGTTIDVDDIEFHGEKKGQSFEINKKTDSTNGYTLESNLPSEQNAGTYTLTYSYEGFTIKVNVIINKKVVTLPELNGQAISAHVTYNGTNYTDQIEYNHNEIEKVTEGLVNGTEPTPDEHIGIESYYTVQFKLKSETNYKWPEGVSSEVQDGKYHFNFRVEKIKIALEKETYLKSSDRLDYSSLSAAPKTINEFINSGDLVLDNDLISDFTDDVELKIVEYSGDIANAPVVTNIESAGSYTIALFVKNPAHYELFYGGNGDPYIELVTVVISA